MAAQVYVLDSSARRATIKVTPGKYLTDVLEEACAKLGYKSSNYGLKHNNKPVDISRTFRQSGLSPGAKLELILASRSPSVVSVALQLPQSLASSVPNGRLVDKFASDTTLWLILRKFESTGETNLNFTARGMTQVEDGASGAGRIFYEQPVLNVVGRELSTLEDLQKTLAQLGLNSGTTLIRLEFKTTERPLEEAMVQIEQYFKEEDVLQPSVPVESRNAAPKEVDTITAAIARLPSAEPTSSEDVDMTSTNASEGTSADPTPYPEIPGDGPLPTAVTPSKRPAPESGEEQILGPDQRPLSVFSPPANDTPKAALVPHNEDDFEPTIAHAKLHQSRLLNSTQNKRLLSDAETEQLELERAAKLASTKEVSIKIRFPDQSTIVSTFTAQETCTKLYAFVNGVIAAEDQPFKLVWTSKGPQTVPKDEKRKLIKDLGFEGRMLVNFVWDDAATEGARKGSTLKPQYVQSAKQVQVPEPPPAPKEDDEKPVDSKGKGKEDGGKGEGKPKGVPKWLQKLSKK
ncbi:GLUT4 regulating protein TUG domain containing protein [Hyaloscypha variabilis]